MTIENLIVIIKYTTLIQIGGGYLKKTFSKLFAFVLVFLLFIGCSNATDSDISEDVSESLSTSASITDNSTYTEQSFETPSLSSQAQSQTLPSTVLISSATIDVPTTTTAKTTTTATTYLPTTTTQKAPVPVVIPIIKTASSPEKETYGNNLAMIDVSNKSEGYFTAKYTGNSKKVKIQVSKDGKKYAYDLSTNGSYEAFPFQMGNGTYSIFIGENVSGTSYAGVLIQDISVSVTNGNAMYLYSNQQINFNQNSKAVIISAEICEGKSTDVEKVSAIFEYISATIKYDYTLASQITSGAISTYLPNPDRTLSTQKGICYDYAALFAAMCRAQGIPAKLVKGYVGADSLYHAWNDVYITGTGWITADFKLSSIGWNSLDSTFYASSTNKKNTAAKFSDGSYYRAAYFY